MGVCFAIISYSLLLVWCPVKAVLCITKTCLYNFDPLKSHFYTVKLGFIGVYIIVFFLFLLKT